MLKSVDNPGVRLTSVRVEFRTTCSVVGHPFEGEIQITYRPGDSLVEFESLEGWAADLRRQEFTLESLATHTLDQVEHLLECAVRVDVWARSAAHPPAWALAGDDNLPCPNL